MKFQKISASLEAKKRKKEIYMWKKKSLSTFNHECSAICTWGFQPRTEWLEKNASNSIQLAASQFFIESSQIQFSLKLACHLFVNHTPISILHVRSDQIRDEWHVKVAENHCFAFIINFQLKMFNVSDSRMIERRRDENLCSLLKVKQNWNWKKVEARRHQWKCSNLAEKSLFVDEKKKIQEWANCSKEFFFQLKLLYYSIREIALQMRNDIPLLSIKIKIYLILLFLFVSLASFVS